MTDALHFRLAGPRDARVLRALVRSFYREGGFAWNARVSWAAGELLRNPDWGRAWLFGEAGGTAGYVVLCFGFSLELGGRDAFVDEVYVKPALRGRGLGRCALEFALGEARELGIKAVHLEAAKGRKPLIRLYKSLGFVPRDHPFLTRRLAT